MKPYKGRDIDGYIAGLDDGKLPIVQELRRLVKDTIPGSREIIKWGTLVIEKNKIIGSINVHKAKVNLQFWRGAELVDKSHILLGDTKLMRHATFTQVSDIRKGPLKDLLRQAGKMD